MSTAGCCSEPWRSSAGRQSSPGAERGVGADTGAVLIAAACLAWGIDNNLIRKLSSADPVLTAMIKGLAAGTVNAGLAVLGGAAIPAVAIVGASAMVGFVGIGISLVLFVLALRHLGTARTSAYFSLAPFIGAVLAIGLLHEAVTREPRARRSLDGVRAMDASRRTPRARASARGVRTRAQP